MRFLLLMLLVAASEASGQRGCGLASDPSKRIEGTGLLPPGWLIRFDPTPKNCTPLKTADLSFATMGTGLHAITGPAAVFYHPADSASGDFTVSATFSNRTTAGHEAFGVFVGGRNLQDSTQRYLYFVVKPNTGEILINRRIGDGPPTPVENVRTDGAIAKEPAGGGPATNKVAIRVTQDSVQFLANDRLVRAIGKSALAGFSTDGIVGLRVNHNLNLHIEGFGVKRP